MAGDAGRLPTLWRTVFGFFDRRGRRPAWSEHLHDQLRHPSARATAARADRRADRLPVGTGCGDRRAARRGYDAGKQINGRKRHIVVDTTGLLLAVLVTAASVQDRDGA